MNEPQQQLATQPASPFALKKKPDAPKDIMALLQSDSIRKKVELALPRHMRPDRMLRVMLTAVSSNPKLKACTQTSLLSCLMKCSAYGLEPDGRHAHLIPFKDECTLIFDYKGLISLVRRSGEVKTIHADVVYEADDFEYHYGSGAFLKHKPSLDPKRRDGDMKCAYSFIVMSTGEESFEVVPLEEVLAVRDNSQGFKAFKSGYTKSNPWDSNFDEMAKKTAFRRHTKWLPLSFELQEAVTADDETKLDERRFNAAKVVTPTDLGAPQITLVSDSDDVPMEYAGNAEEVAQPETPPVVEKKPEPKRAAKTGTPLTQLQAMMTLEQISDVEVIEVLVRKGQCDGAKDLKSVPAQAIDYALANSETIFAQIRMDRSGHQQPN